MPSLPTETFPFCRDKDADVSWVGCSVSSLLSTSFSHCCHLRCTTTINPINPILRLRRLLQLPNFFPRNFGPVGGTLVSELSVGIGAKHSGSSVPLRAALRLFSRQQARRGAALSWGELGRKRVPGTLSRSSTFHLISFLTLGSIPAGAERFVMEYYWTSRIHRRVLSATNQKTPTPGWLFFLDRHTRWPSPSQTLVIAHICGLLIRDKKGAPGKSLS